VVDDASTDNTAEVVQQFCEGRVRYLRHETNWKVSAARNTGVLNARGEFIAFLDDDDEWLETKLERQVGLLDDCADVVGGVYTGFVKIDRTTGELLASVVPSKRGHILHELGRSNCIGTASTVMLRKKCFDEVGLFDETIDFGEEYDMWIRIAHRFDFTYAAEPLVRYSIHEERLSTNYGTMIRGLDRQLRKHGKFFAASPENFSRRYIALGALYCYTRDVEKGREAFRKAIQISPLMLKQYLYLGLSLFGFEAFRRVMRRNVKSL
jgi:glycosyltransferase involved in cell wall biosynthesis